MKLTYRDFEFELKDFKNNFDGAIYQYIEGLEEVLGIYFGHDVGAEIFVKKNDIDIFLGELDDKEETFDKCNKLKSHFKEKQNILDFYEYIRKASPYKVKLLAALGPMKTIKVNKNE